MEINNILQGLIYSFNDENVRNSVIQSSLARYPKSPAAVVWKGTIHLDKDHEQFKEYRKWKLTSPKIYLFTVMYTYGDDCVHYVAFILDMKTRQLTCFDPGYNLYLYGKQKIIPIVVEELRRENIIVHDVVLRTSCPRKRICKKYGLQYNGKDMVSKTSLPADAFCQTWTMYFLMTFLEHGCSTQFFIRWCKIPPRYRESFLISSFLIPRIQVDAALSKMYGAAVPLLQQYLLESFWMKL